MSQRGGKRKGAGRKPGAINKRTEEIRAKAEELGILPLDVMLQAMHEAYTAGGPAAAFPFAKDAAPYLHAKLATTELHGKDGKALFPTKAEELTDEHLAAIAAGGRTAPSRSSAS